MKTSTNTVALLMLILLFCQWNTNCQQISAQLSHPLQKNYITTKKKSDGDLGIFGFIIGPILFILSFVGVWFNQKRAAVNYRRLKLSETLLDTNNSQHQYNLDNMNNQLMNQKKLIYRTGHSQVTEGAKDQECQVYPYQALVLQRKVEVKQMRSHTKRRSGQDQIQYRLEWVSQNIENCESQYNSPTKWFIKSNTFYAPQARLSNYLLNISQLSQLECDKMIYPQPQTLHAIKNIAMNANSSGQQIVFNEYIYFPASNGDVESRGTLRVKFQYCESTQLSVICSANQYSQTYEQFRIDQVDNMGQQDSLPCEDAQCCICCAKLAEMLKPMTEINLILKGNFTSHEMIELSIKKNMTQTNLLRLAFFALMVIGICIFFSPITNILGYLPLVGGFLKGTAGIIIFIGAFLVSIPLFGVTFGLAWFRYHPAIGGTVLASAAVILLAFYILGKH